MDYYYYQIRFFEKLSQWMDGKCSVTQSEKEFLNFPVLEIKKIFTVRRKAGKLFKAEGSAWLNAHLAISLQIARKLFQRTNERTNV